MWMARLYPTYEPNTCLISNGLSTMAFALPGAVGAKLAAPDHKVLAAVGDGAFLMNSQELETAIREHVPVAVLIWEDHAYGLIGWKMDLELGHHVEVGFSNPDFVAYAESFGARGYRVGATSDLRPMLQEALAADTVSGIDCPVDYTENPPHRGPGLALGTLLTIFTSVRPRTRHRGPPRRCRAAATLRRRHRTTSRRSRISEVSVSREGRHPS